MIKKIHSEDIRGVLIELTDDSIWTRRFRGFKPTESKGEFMHSKRSIHRNLRKWVRKRDSWVRVGEPHLGCKIFGKRVCTGCSGHQLVPKVKERSSFRAEVRTDGADLVPLMDITTMEILFQMVSDKELFVFSSRFLYGLPSGLQLRYVLKWLSLKVGNEG